MNTLNPLSTLKTPKTIDLDDIDMTPNSVSYYLWLDDYRPIPSSEWVLAKDLNEFKTIITENGIPKYVSFDHDLNESHYQYDYSDRQTGMDAIIWMIDYVKENKAKPPKWGVHTMNNERMPFMIDALNSVWPNHKRSWVDVWNSGYGPEIQ